MKIYLVRHTSVAVPKGVCYGQTDVPLSTSFEEEALIVKEKLAAIHPNAVFTSPLNRCLWLACFCGFDNAMQDNRLKELHFGDWENRPWDEIDMSVWAADWINPPAPSGESFMRMYERVAAFFDQLSRDAHNTVIIFTHGGVINCARIYFQQTDIPHAFAWTPANGEIVEFCL
jgi:alpha-ribazole phosphatase